MFIDTIFQHHRDQFGTRQALLLLLRRRLPVLGYAVLTAAIAVSLAGVRQEGTDRRNDLAKNAKVVIVAGCKRDNQTRATLRNLINSNEPQVRRYVKEGLLTKEQGDRAIAESRKASAKLKDTNCVAAGQQFEAQG